MRKTYFFIALLAIVSVVLAILSKNNSNTTQNPITSTVTQQADNSKEGAVAKIGEAPDFLSVKQGFVIGIFAQNIPQARDLEFSKNGTLLVSSLQGNIYALPDKNNDGVADEIKIIISDLEKPHGIAFFEDKLYVAEETRVSRYNWDEQNLKARLDKVLFSLPKGGNHFTRSLLFDKNGKLYVSIGSTCNVCFEKDEKYSSVLISDKDGKNPRVFAKGLRNSVFLALNPQTNQVWATEMGRDLLGDTIPPDEINILKENNDYGWPICYGNKIHDTQFDKQPQKVRPLRSESSGSKTCEITEAPIYEIPAHSAPLGLVFIESEQFPKEWQGDLLVSYHGSWNRTKPDGYKVVRINIEANTANREEDFITGFLPESATSGSFAIGRPVDLAFDNKGSLYISDDKAGAIYKVVEK